MKYTRKNRPDSDTMQLQGIGHVVGRPAQEAVVGDVLMWNFGEKDEVLSIGETEKFVSLTTRSLSSGYVGTRKLKKTRLICILEK